MGVVADKIRIKELSFGFFRFAAQTNPTMPVVLALGHTV